MEQLCKIATFQSLSRNSVSKFLIALLQTAPSVLTFRLISNEVP
jgi:hypothetical protein